jgi:SAM-dependent methyltransferase
VTFQPSAPGTQRDVAEQTDLAREVEFFGSLDHARRFVTLGLEKVSHTWPQRIAYVDFGGGPGVLARVVRDHLRARGHEVDATVADSNPRFLERAQQLGLAVELCNLEECALRDLDLVTMRLVNHYNDPQRQQQILEVAHRALKPEGVLVSQIETGGAGGCRARTAIANLPALNGDLPSGYHWATLPEYLDMLARAGFATSQVMGTSEDDLPVDVALDLAWRRFNANRIQRAQARGDAAAVAAAQARRIEFFAQARQIIDTIVAGNGDDPTGIHDGGRVMHASLPVIVSNA